MGNASKLKKIKVPKIHLILTWSVVCVFSNKIFQSSLPPPPPHTHTQIYGPHGNRQSFNDSPHYYIIVVVVVVVVVVVLSDGPYYGLILNVSNFTSRTILTTRTRTDSRKANIPSCMQATI